MALVDGARSCHPGQSLVDKLAAGMICKQVASCAGGRKMRTTFGECSRVGFGNLLEDIFFTIRLQWELHLR